MNIPASSATETFRNAFCFLMSELWNHHLFPATGLHLKSKFLGATAPFLLLAKLRQVDGYPQYLKSMGPQE